MTLRDAILVLACAPLAIQSGEGQSRDAESYAAVSVDKNGALAIRKATGETVAVFKRRTQTTFAKPRLSPDRTAAGAQAMYPNCCTSYDIPLALVIYADGREHWFKGDGLPIFRWHFAEGGSRVAYSQETVHFSCGTHYELREIRSERLVAAITIPAPGGGCPPAKAVAKPAWVKKLDADRSADPGL